MAGVASANPSGDNYSGLFKQSLDFGTFISEEGRFLMFVILAHNWWTLLLRGILALVFSVLNTDACRLG
jgi:hypothetical protein